MATNKLLPFANGVGANVIDYASWSAKTTLLSGGFVTGIAKSEEVNRLLSQGALASYILGQLVVDQIAQDADLNETTFYTNFKNALKSYIEANAVALNGAQTVGGVKTFTASPVVPTKTTGDSSTDAASTAFVQGEIASRAVLLTGNQTVAGTKTFSASPLVPTIASRFDQSQKAVNAAWAYGLATQGNALELIDLGAPDDLPWAEIDTGNFRNCPVGGYVTANSHRYYLGHHDYWLGTGDTECTTHHVLVVPAENLTTGKMNDTATTAGGYAGCDFKTGANSNTGYATLESIIQTDWGASRILSHREYFTNAVTNGQPSGATWYDSTIDLMSETMVYGCKIFEPMGNGSITPSNYTVDKSQIELFRRRPDLITVSANWLLRGVVTASTFAYVNSNGTARYGGASDSLGFRPAFGVKAAS